MDIRDDRMQSSSEPLLAGKELSMKKGKIPRQKDPFVQWLLLGIPILFILATPLHFLYDWTGKCLVAGLFTPTNESPWEHLKLTFWPILVWWLIGYLLFLRKEPGGFQRAVLSCTVSALSCLMFIVAFYYTFRGAFGAESLILDILSLLLGLAVSTFLTIHVYRYSSPGAFSAFIAVLLLSTMAAAFLCFTFSPPHMPLFQDPPSGAYGIPASGW